MRLNVFGNVYGRITLLFGPVVIVLPLHLEDLLAQSFILQKYDLICSMRPELFLFIVTIVICCHMEFL